MDSDNELIHVQLAILVNVRKEPDSLEHVLIQPRLDELVPCLSIRKKKKHFF